MLSISTKHPSLFQHSASLLFKPITYNTSLLSKSFKISPLRANFSNYSRSSFRHSIINFNKSATKPTADILNWNQFLALRAKRRKTNLICSLFTAGAGIVIGWGFISNIEIDPTELIMGFDPIMVYGFGLVLCGLAGYLVGPTVGDLVFRAMISKQYAQFTAKNIDFLQHIKRNRPDPSKQSYVNPVVDYYGEKIGSLRDYRRWLRDARVYRNKAEKFL